MKISKLFIIVCILVLNTLTVSAYGAELKVQIYVCSPTGELDVNNIRTGIIEDESMVTNSKIRETELKTTTNQKIYEQGFIPSKSKDRKFVIDLTNERNKYLVYDLDLPKYVRAADWSTWKKPNYVQQGDSVSFMVLHDSKEGISASPENAPRIMYRVINKHLYWDYFYGRKTEEARDFPACD